MIVNGSIDFYNVASWSWASVSMQEPWPSGRAAHSMVLVSPAATEDARASEARLIVFGGNDSHTVKDDVWEFFIVSQTWQQVQAVGCAPQARSGHSAVVHNHQMVVFGGSADGQAKLLNDLHILDTDCMAWYQPQAVGKAPSPRMGHTACVIDNHMFVFGGANISHVMNDLHIFDIVSATWTKPTIAGSIPGARSGHTCVQVGSALCIFGGSSLDGVMYNDMYALETSEFLCSCADERLTI